MDDFPLFVVVGFLAQLVDGAMGMAYGVTATSVLLGVGVPPAVASASVHASEVFTTGASGFSHWRLGNVDRKLLLRLAVPGVIGGVIGAVLLSSLDVPWLPYLVSAYLLCVGGLIVWRSIKGQPNRDQLPKRVAPIGFFGGIMDAIGGGGWGPVVTSTLLGSGGAPRKVIGSVNASEFFLTVAISTTFLFTVGLELWPVIAGLIVGGVVAAPMGALAAKHVPARALMLVVGCVIVGLGVRGVYPLFT